MIVVTGGAGFIGSAFISFLNQKGIDQILVVDALERSPRWKNLSGRAFIDYLHRDEFLQRLEQDALPKTPSAIVHLGACSSTTETDADFLMRNNFRYSCTVAEYCATHEVRLIYASSAATYGAGEGGYSDEVELNDLKPLNPYGLSKHLFDLWMRSRGFPGHGAGMKFFNVFGPGEWFKGDMASVVLKSWQQIRDTGKVRLFKSYRSDFQDGEQKRDFVYVKDCCEIMWWLLENPSLSGIFNVGSGKARSWNDLVRAVFAAMEVPAQIDYIEMPEPLRAQYQYFTEASLAGLMNAGCPVRFSQLEDAIRDYVVNHLQPSAAD